VLLDLIVQAGDDGVSKEDLAECTDRAMTGGTFRQYLGTLKSSGLVVV